MDLRSCPQEMLANVLKYTTFETVTRIRKTNKHMDYVATKYRINLPKVAAVHICCYGRKYEELSVMLLTQNIWDCEKENEFNLILKQSLLADDERSDLDFVANVLKRVRAVFISLSKGLIDKNITEFLIRIRHRERISICFDNCDFVVPLDELTAVLAKYSSSKVVILRANKIMNEPMGTDVVINALLPYTGIHNYFKDRHPAFTDEALRTASKYMPYTFHAGWNCPFSVEEIKKTMLRLAECFERNERRLTTWKFGGLQFNSEEEWEQATKELSAVPATVVETTGDNVVWIVYKKEP